MARPRQFQTANKEAPVVSNYSGSKLDNQASDLFHHMWIYKKQTSLRKKLQDHNLQIKSSFLSNLFFFKAKLNPKSRYVNQTFAEQMIISIFFNKFLLQIWKQVFFQVSNKLIIFTTNYFLDFKES